jgi:hypothetical protein
MSKSFPVGSTLVKLDCETWASHGRSNSEVRVLCVDNPYSDYDGFRGFKPTLEEVVEGLDWIIENEHQTNMSGYTQEQAQALRVEMHKLMVSFIDR